MTTLQYLTHKDYGCCTIRELLELSRMNKKDMEDLKQAAEVEMKAKGIEITQSS
jgi:hypothetical protein